MTKDIKTIILQELINNQEYMKRVLPFLKGEYFETAAEKKIFDIIYEYVTQYNHPPTLDSIFVSIQKDRTITEDLVKQIDEMSVTLKEYSGNQLDWLINITEEFCKERAIYNGLMNSIDIYQNKKGNIGSIPDILRDALSVGFDNNIGHDFFDSAVERYKYYHDPQKKIPFRLSYFNKITNGGVSSKTLNLIVSGTNVGKSLHMCSLAADNLLDGKNVLYITLEMAAEEIASRIDANLMDVPVNDVKQLPKEHFFRAVDRVRQKTNGTLIIKEYPTSSADISNFRVLLNELKLKRNFVPDILYIDYLNICSSFRLRGNKTANSFTYYKVIAEELRGLAQEFDFPIISASQTNRSGYSSSDPNMEDIAESFGVAMTGDLIYSLSVTDELIEKGQMLVKQLKNRYDDKNRIPKFLIGVDRPKMRCYDLENESQEGLIIDTPIADNTNYQQKQNQQKPDFKSKFKF